MNVFYNYLLPLILLGFCMQSCDQSSQDNQDNEDNKKGYFLYSKEEDTEKGKDETIKRRAPATIQRHLLDSADELKAKLFGKDYTLLIEQRERRDAYRSYSGKVKGHEQSSVLFHLRGKTIRGSIQLKTTKFEISDNAKQAIIEEVDQSGFPDKDDGIEVKPDTLSDTLSHRRDIIPDMCNEIDVLVLYTEDAKESEGGEADMESRIGLAFMETNTSYENSGVTHELNNVGMEEVDFDDPKSSSESLNWLEDDSDVEQMRNNHNADIVVMIVEDFNNNYCGRANIQSNVSPSFADKAFAVVKRSCMTGYYSFGHEIGHIMGCRHNCEQDDNDEPYDYSHGFSFCPDNGSSWRTIMSYRECSNTRIPYWSNPNNTRNGNDMGSNSGDCKSYNVKTLNNTAQTVANFRNSQECQANLCDVYPVLCNPRYEPPELIKPPVPIIKFPHGGAVPVDEICKYVLNCPGCGGANLCPGPTFKVSGLNKNVVLKVVNGQGEVINKNANPESIRTIKTGKINPEQEYFILLLNKEDQLLQEPVTAKFEVVREGA